MSEGQAGRTNASSKGIRADPGVEENEEDDEVAVRKRRYPCGQYLQ